MIQTSHNPAPGHPSTARKILWNTLSQVIGKVGIALLGIVVIKMITNYLGDDTAIGPYGEYTTAFEFLAFFSIVADLGLYTVGVREMAKDEKKISMIVGNILTIRTIVGILMIAIAIITAFIIPKYQGTQIPFAIILVGASAILNLITSTISTVLQVHLKMEYNSLASFIGRVISVSYMALAIYVLYPADKDTGFYHLIIAGIIGNAVMLGITYYYSAKLTKVKYAFDKIFWKDVLIKALPYGIALVLNTIYFRIGSVMLSLIKTTTEVGIYGVPMRMLEAVGIIPLYFMNAVLPVLTRALNRKDGSHEKIIQYAFDFLVMGSMPIVAGTVILATPLIYLISNANYLSRVPEGFYGSDITLQILIFALAFSFINSLFGFILVADNRQTKLLIRNAIGAVLTLVLDITLIPHFGVRAAAFDNVVTELYVAVASYFLAKHYIKFKLKFTNTIKIFISTLVMALSVYLLKGPLYQLTDGKNIFIVLVLIPLGALVYTGMLFLTKTITPEMLALVKRKPAKPAESLELPL